MGICRNQIFDTLYYLEETGVPCKVTLYYKKRYGQPFKGIPVNLDDISNPQLSDVFKKTRRFHLKVKIGKHMFVIKNYHHSRNQLYIDDIKRLIRNEYGEYILNHERWKKLDEILNDTNPPTLE